MTRLSPHRAAVSQALDTLIMAYDQDVRDVDGLTDIYATALGDLVGLDILAGAAAVVKAERFFPRPATLRRYAVEAREARVLATEPQARRDPEACRFCGATGVWFRAVRPSPPDPARYRTHRAHEAAARAALAAAEARSATQIERAEAVHRPGCPLRHPDQPTDVGTGTTYYAPTA